MLKRRLFKLLLIEAMWLAYLTVAAQHLVRSGIIPVLTASPGLLLPVYLFQRQAKEEN